MNTFLEMFHLMQGGRRWYEMNKSQGFFIPEAQTNKMLPFRCYSGKGVGMVSDGTFPGNVERAEGGGYIRLLDGCRVNGVKQFLPVDGKIKGGVTCRHADDSTPIHCGGKSKERRTQPNDIFLRRTQSTDRPHATKSPHPRRRNHL